MLPTRSPRYLLQLALASLVTAAAVAAVCGVGLVSLRDFSATTRKALTDQTALLNEASAFEALLFDKGFVANYLLTHNRQWLEQLAANRTAFQGRLERALRGSSERGRALLMKVQVERAEYDNAREQVLRLFDQGEMSRATTLLESSHQHIERLLGLCQEMRRLGRADAEQTLLSAQAALDRLSWLLVATSLAAALASIAVGFFLSRSIARPIYALQLQIESAAQRTRLRVPDGKEGLEAVEEQVRALVTRIEETDATLAEQRRRLLQSEKLSAMGEMAAKLAHEILNPLTGMKAAIQRIARKRPQAVAREDVVATADALTGEIARVEDLVRRLMDYARPLAPKIEVCPVEHLVGAAERAARSAISPRELSITRRIDTTLPPVEVDPSLIVQALTNLLTNAAQAMPGGGSVEVAARRATEHGREHVVIEVADEGPGIAPQHLPQLFHPFFTTRDKGHGLGLAVCQNIVLEHGGRVAASNRVGAAGARFEVWLPLVR